MRQAWNEILPQVPDGVQQIKCPSCAKYEIDYLYVGDSKTKVGYLQIWCKECLKGIHVSRARAPANAKFAVFDDELQSIVPDYELIWDQWCKKFEKGIKNRRMQNSMTSIKSGDQTNSALVMS